MSNKAWNWLFVEGGAKKLLVALAAIVAWVLIVSGVLELFQNAVIRP